MSPTRSPDGSGTLVPSHRGLPHGRRLRSHPVWHSLRGFPASNWRGLAPLFHIVRNIQAFPPSVRFVFAPVARPRPGIHGIKQRDYLGVAKFSPLPPPRTQRAPLRALRATQLAPWRGATGTAGNEVRTTRALARPVVQQAGSVLAHLGRTVLLPSQLFCPDRYSAGMPDVNIWESPSLLPVHYSVRGRSYSIEKPGHSRWGHTCSGKLPWGARID